MPFVPSSVRSLLVAMPGAPSSVRSLLVAMPGAPSSVRSLLVAMPGAPSSVRSLLVRSYFRVFRPSFFAKQKRGLLPSVRHTQLSCIAAPHDFGPGTLEAEQRASLLARTLRSGLLALLVVTRSFQETRS